MTRETFNASNPKPKKVAGRVTITRETDMLADKFSLDTSPILREVGAVRDLDNPTEQSRP